MKDIEIFRLLTESTGLSDDDVMDYRPCRYPHRPEGIPTIDDAIVMQLKGNGTLVYIPHHDREGNKIRRKDGM